MAQMPVSSCCSGECCEGRWCAGRVLAVSRECHVNRAMNKRPARGPAMESFEGKHFRQPDRLGMFRKSKEALEPMRRS